MQNIARYKMYYTLQHKCSLQYVYLVYLIMQIFTIYFADESTSEAASKIMWCADCLIYSIPRQNDIAHDLDVVLM